MTWRRLCDTRAKLSFTEEDLHETGNRLYHTMMDVFAERRKLDDAYKHHLSTRQRVARVKAKLKAERKKVIALNQQLDLVRGLNQWLASKCSEKCSNTDSSLSSNSSDEEA